MGRLHDNGERCEEGGADPGTLLWGTPLLGIVDDAGNVPRDVVFAFGSIHGHNCLDGRQSPLADVFVRDEPIPIVNTRLPVFVVTESTVAA